MEQHIISRKDLPLFTELNKVVDFSLAITSEKTRSLEVSQHTNGVSKRFNGSVFEFDLDELLHGRNDDLLTWELGPQINHKSVLVIPAGSSGDCQWESSKSCGGLTAVIKVEPVDRVYLFHITRSADLQDIGANANSSAANVTPETNKLGTNLNIKSQAISKVLVLGKDQVTLSVVLEMLAIPHLEVWVSPASCIRRINASVTGVADPRIRCVWNVWNVI
mmetsp:Transcript_31929/g.77413  ORF Transcript_31929/g.77413 Transcript_31929/m.77413 type:complete len:220 (+) Transcript_31929:3218-3877(+)